MSTAILSFAVLAITQAVVSGQKSTQYALRELRAVSLAEAMLEEITVQAELDDTLATVRSAVGTEFDNVGSRIGSAISSNPGSRVQSGLGSILKKTTDQVDKTVGQTLKPLEKLDVGSLGTNVKGLLRTQLTKVDDFHNLHESLGLCTDALGNVYGGKFALFERLVTVVDATKSGLGGTVKGKNITVTVKDDRGGEWHVSRFIPESRP